MRESEGSGVGIGIGNASMRCKRVGGFQSALLKCELAQMRPEGSEVAQVLKDGSGVCLLGHMPSTGVAFLLPQTIAPPI